MGRAIPPDSGHGREVRDHVRMMLGKLQAHIRAERTDLVEGVTRSQAKREGVTLTSDRGARRLRPYKRKKEE
jgi:hypothetical protein